MKFTDKKQQLDYLLELIEKGNTGTADGLCKRICVSKRTLERYMSELREIGFRISFCSQRRTYYLVKKMEEN